MRATFGAAFGRSSGAAAIIANPSTSVTPLPTGNLLLNIGSGTNRTFAPESGWPLHRTRQLALTTAVRGSNIRRKVAASSSTEISSLLSRRQCDRQSASGGMAASSLRERLPFLSVSNSDISSLKTASTFTLTGGIRAGPLLQAVMVTSKAAVQTVQARMMFQPMEWIPGTLHPIIDAISFAVIKIQPLTDPAAAADPAVVVGSARQVCRFDCMIP